MSETRKFELNLTRVEAIALRYRIGQEHVRIKGQIGHEKEAELFKRVMDTLTVEIHLPWRAM